MTDLIVVPQAAQWQRLKRMVLDSVSSPITRRVYNLGLDEFFEWDGRDGRWCIVDLVGKHGRVRTIPMPTWVKVAQDAWTASAGVANGFVFRPVNRGGQAQSARLSEKVVWQLLQVYAMAAAVPGIAPH